TTLFEVLLERSAPPISAQLTPGLWLAGLALGVTVALLGTLLPAWEASRVSPLASLRGSRLVDRRGVRLMLWSLAALPLLGLAAALLLPAHGALPGALIGATALALGGALLCPAAVWLLSTAVTGALRQLLGAVGLLAGRNLARSTSRLGLAAASLMVALALALAIQITVRSFRQTFLLWLNQAITADLYLSPATPGRDARFPMQLVPELRRQPFVRDFAELTLRRVLLAGQEALVAGINVDIFARTSSLPMVEGDPARALAQLRGGAAWVSETLAYPLGLHAGDALTLPTGQGPRQVQVAAVVQNYSVPTGIVYLDQATYSRLLGPQVPREAAIWLNPGTSVEAAQQALESLPDARLLSITPNRLLRQEALRAFDRTFAITGLMGGLATLVAFIAMISALTALLHERQRIQGYLRAIGVSRRVLGTSLALEAALLALAAALMSWGVGLLMAAVLVFVINKRAFGWSLQFLPASGGYLGLLALALAAALLGTLYPLWRSTRGSFLATIREE
ncbi:MAG TPA: FtsX-like permease family protein, partial [bacterium]|nr:FtsX-like permease family protein [bacterium]